MLGYIVGYCGQYLCGSQELWGTKKTLRCGGFARGTLCRFNSVEARGTRPELVGRRGQTGKNAVNHAFPADYTSLLSVLLA